VRDQSTRGILINSESPDPDEIAIRYDAMSASDKGLSAQRDDAPTKLVDEEVEGQLEELDTVAEGKLVRKLDLFVIPVVMLLYLLSFLDR
jgi:hypothetical protein